MELGIAEEFGSTVVLDAQLTAVSSTGLNVNSGVHPLITVKNLLRFLPIDDFTFEPWDETVTYSAFDPEKKRGSIVLAEDGVSIYQSLKDDNLDNPVTDPEWWMLTNIESLRIKAFFQKVRDKVSNDLNLTPRLISNQYLYEIGKHEIDLQGDYSAWIFEPKGSDYVKFTLNEVSFQGMTDDPVNLYVINQGVLLETLILQPDNGLFEFKRLDKTFSGKGRFIFAIDAQRVKVDGGYIDSLKYNGFVAYTSTGFGDSPESARYGIGGPGNGLGFNVTVMSDPAAYVANTANAFAPYIRACFEYMVFQMMLTNSNARSNREEREVAQRELLVTETMELKANTSVSRYMNELKKAQEQIRATFDTQLYMDNTITVRTSSL